MARGVTTERSDRGPRAVVRTVATPFFAIIIYTADCLEMFSRDSGGWRADDCTTPYLLIVSLDRVVVFYKAQRPGEEGTAQISHGKLAA